jgi:hypothetical protein
VEIIDYDGHEWMRGHGFPGWANAGRGIFVTLLLGGGSAFGCWQIAHEHRDWANVLDIVWNLLEFCGLAIMGLAAAVVALFSIAALREWMTIYLIRTDAGAIIVEFQRYFGLVHRRRELPTSSVSAVTTRMASASGDNIITDISVVQEGGTMKVFRSGSPTEVEMLVIYLNAACGRHAGAGTAAQISEHWSAIKLSLDAKRGTLPAAATPLSPPPGTTPSP